MEKGLPWESLSIEQQESILRYYRQEELFKKVFWSLLAVIVISASVLAIYQ